MPELRNKNPGKKVNKIQDGRLKFKINKLKKPLEFYHCNVVVVAVVAIV